ncbi:hypothetical protein MFLAVUS_006757 [Mucor flavus]|uniref:Uncharacterized protein n=1 Tax=Mucor flavus TaxID=439312 RepID=A0ABP9Z2G2_9FUNG
MNTSYSTFYLAIFIVALIMMVLVVPSSKKTCQFIKDTHASSSVCKNYCDESGYWLRECGGKGICICKNKTTPKKYTAQKKE